MHHSVLSLYCDFHFPFPHSFWMCMFVRVTCCVLILVAPQQKVLSTVQHVGDSSPLKLPISMPPEIVSCASKIHLQSMSIHDFSILLPGKRVAPGHRLCIVAVQLTSSSMTSYLFAERGHGCHLGTCPWGTSFWRSNIGSSNHTPSLTASRCLLFWHAHSVHQSPLPL